jgi:hypothetical protein
MLTQISAHTQAFLRALQKRASNPPASAQSDRVTQKAVALDAGRSQSTWARARVSALVEDAAGFTTVVDMDSRGGFGTVELRNAINSGLVQGPRMQVAGQSLNPRPARPTPNTVPGFFTAFIEGKNINGPWLARAAVRELKLHGADGANVYTTQDFVGDELREFRPDGSLVASRRSRHECIWRASPRPSTPRQGHGE